MPAARAGGRCPALFRPPFSLRQSARFIPRAVADVGGTVLFAGPIIAREVLTAPRPMRYYLWRASFVCFLFILLWTAWQSFIGWEVVRELGVMARFGGILYWLFAMLQLTLMLFFAPLFTAAAVSYEKDRRTFTLLAHDGFERSGDRAGKAGRRATQYFHASWVPAWGFCPFARFSAGSRSRRC